jgi:hypothetical protein
MKKRKQYCAEIGKGHEPDRSRRAFVGVAARKAAYVAPAVMMLKAASTVEAGGASCGIAGSPCTVDADCCTGLTCQTGGMACMPGDMGCMCE